MPIQLDPFHMLRAINCPKEISVSDIGYVQIADAFQASFLWNRRCNEINTLDECLIELDLSGYWSSFQWDLYGQVVDCSQQTYFITGRDSGKTLNLDFVTGLNALNLDCQDLCSPFGDCYLLIDGNFVDVQELNTTSVTNYWNPATNRHTHLLSVYSGTNTLGFTLDERIDLKLSPFSYAIVSITERSVSSIWIEAVGHLIPVNSNVEVKGTTSYDGLYSVVAVSGDLLAVNVTYISDESPSAATVSPYYQSIV